MMNLLWEQGGISQQEIARKTGRKRAATGRMIDTLEKNGLIEREYHKTDRRLKLIYLTQAGIAVQSEVKCTIRS